MTVGPASKVKPSFSQIIGPPAGLVARLDDGRFDAGRLQPDGEREAAEAGADDDRACGS